MVGWGDLIGGAQVYVKSLTYLLRIGGLSLGSRPFRFFNAWVEYPKLHTIVKEKWEKSEKSFGRLWGHLKVLRRAIHNWHIEHFSRYNKKFKDSESALSSLLSGHVPNG